MIKYSLYLIRYFLYLMFSAKEKLKMFIPIEKEEKRKGPFGMFTDVKYLITIPFSKRKISFEWRRNNCKKSSSDHGVWIVFFIISGLIAFAFGMVSIEATDKITSELSLVASVLFMTICAILIGHNVFNK